MLVPCLQLDRNRLGIQITDVKGLLDGCVHKHLTKLDDSRADWDVLELIQV